MIFLSPPTKSRAGVKLQKLDRIDQHRREEKHADRGTTAAPEDGLANLNRCVRPEMGGRWHRGEFRIRAPRDKPLNDRSPSWLIPHPSEISALEYNSFHVVVVFQQIDQLHDPRWPSPPDNGTVMVAECHFGEAHLMPLPSIALVHCFELARSVKIS